MGQTLEMCQTPVCHARRICHVQSSNFAKPSDVKQCIVGRRWHKDNGDTAEVIDADGVDDALGRPRLTVSKSAILPLPTVERSAADSMIPTTASRWIRAFAQSIPAQRRLQARERSSPAR